MDREVVLKRFNYQLKTPDREASTEPNIDLNTWNCVDKLLTKLYKEVDSQKVRELKTSVYRVTT
jgi:hypothetical protein